MYRAEAAAERRQVDYRIKLSKTRFIIKHVPIRT